MGKGKYKLLLEVGPLVASIAPVMTIFQDEFEQVDGTELKDAIPNIGTGYTQVLKTGALNDVIEINSSTENAQPRQLALGDGYGCTCDAVYPSANYQIEIEVAVADSNDDVSLMGVRFQDINNNIFAYFNEDELRIYKRVGGTFTDLTGNLGGVNDNDFVRLRVQGTNVKLFVNDVEQDSVTVADAGLQPTGKAWVGMGAYVNSGDDMDDQGWCHILVKTL